MKRFVPTAVELRSEAASPEELLVLFRGDALVLVEEPDSFRLPTGAELPAEFSVSERLVIGRIGGADCSLIPLSEEAPVPEPLKPVELRAARLRLGGAEEIAVCRARELAFWRRNHRYCGRCGAPLTDHATECARQCTACGALFYPVIAPAIIVAVTDGAGRLLLAHNAKFRGDMHGLVAGFVEAGETMEEAVRRELREEVRLEVKNIRYFASQSWPYPNSLMAGFTAETVEEDAVPMPDMREITSAGFYTPADMPEVPQPGSIARRMIDHWRENYKGNSHE